MIAHGTGPPKKPSNSAQDPLRSCDRSPWVKYHSAVLSAKQALLREVGKIVCHLQWMLSTRYTQFAPDMDANYILMCHLQKRKKNHHESHVWAIKRVRRCNVFSGDITPRCKEDRGWSKENGYGKRTKNGEVSWSSLMAPLEFLKEEFLWSWSRVEVKRDYNVHSGKVFAFYRMAQDVQARGETWRNAEGPPIFCVFPWVFLGHLMGLNAFQFD